MREKTTNGQVIIVYTEHPVFGILLIPYIAERLEDGTLQLIEQAFHASPEAIEQMNEAERQAIDIASHYTEKYLMGAYSREKIVSRFLHKLSQDPEKVKSPLPHPQNHVWHVPSSLHWSHPAVFYLPDDTAVTHP